MSTTRKPNLEELVLMAQAVSNNSDIPSEVRVRLGGTIRVAVLNEVSDLCSRHPTLRDLSYADRWSIAESLILHKTTH